MALPDMKEEGQPSHTSMEGAQTVLSGTLVEVLPHYRARIVFNSRGWTRPCPKEERAREAGKSFQMIYGFGHEDWLFRFDWSIDGWQYAFLQGVNKNPPKASPFNVSLYTLEPKKKRRYVATLFEAESLDKVAAEEAVECLRASGRMDVMAREVDEIGGDASGLGHHALARSVLNVRFRVSEVRWHPVDCYADIDDPVCSNLKRYSLYRVNERDAIDVERIRSLSVTATQGGERLDLPELITYLRKGSAPKAITPEHRRMQRLLIEALRREHPSACVDWERGGVDVWLRHLDGRVVLFEIKTALLPRVVIREAIGQLLEYGYRGKAATERPEALVIVGRQEPSPVDRSYLDALAGLFRIPVQYRTLRL